MTERDEYSLALESLLARHRHELPAVDQRERQAVEVALIVDNACDELEANTRLLTGDTRGLRRQ